MPYHAEKADGEEFTGDDDEVLRRALRAVPLSDT